MECSRTTLNIAEFYIDPTYKKKGLGCDFLEKIVEWGKSKGARNLSVDVDTDLPVANGFWDSLGLKKKLNDRFNYSGSFATIKKRE